MLAQYLKHTQDRGLVLVTNSDIFKVDAYPDSDFAGMYGHKNTDDLVCTKSCTVFIITFADCPVLWIPKFQTENALSKMEEEIITLDNCCQDIFPIIDITKSLGKEVGLPSGVPPIKVSFHEYNAGA